MLSSRQPGPRCTGAPRLARWRRGQVALGLGIGLMVLSLLAGGAWVASGAAQDAAAPPEEDEVSLDPSAVPEPGDDVRVVVDKGEAFFDGTLEAQTEDQLILSIRGVLLPLDRERVVSVTVRLTPAQRYRDIRPTIRDDDLPRLLALVRYLERHTLYDEAMRELEGILSRDPDNEEARRLAKVVEQLIVLQELREQRQRSGEGENPIEAPETPRDRSSMPDRNNFETLSEEQINLIKVYEIDLKAEPRLIIQRSTVDEILKRYAEHPLVPITREGKEAFYRKTPVEILDIMFRVGARDLYKEVRVLGQPESMQKFRNDISARWLTNRCATTRCHGGSEAGRLRLLNRSPNSEPTVYSNFLLLDRFDTRRPVPMIDYTNPTDSLLLQMALPREDVLYPHPDVKGWRPVFVNDRSPQYRAAVAWMRMMYQPRPDYPIEYNPFEESDGQPAAPNPGEQPVER